MSYQTSEPVTDLRMEISGRSVGEIVRWLQDGDATYDLPYQRGSVWTDEQRIMLILSMLSGTPIPALIINDRPQRMWFDDDGGRLPIYAIIDGKQRLTTFRTFREDALAVPASWFDPAEVEVPERTDDGPYVRYSGLTRRQQLSFDRVAVPVAVGKLDSVAAEAAVYLRVNGSGTPQSADDMARAARVASA